MYTLTHLLACACRASQHWQRVVQRHVVSCWQKHTAKAIHKWQQLAKALCFNKHTLQCTAIASWRLAIAQLLESRAAAAQHLQRWQEKQLMQTLLHAVRAWRSVAEQQGYLQQMHVQLSQRLQQQRMHQVSRLPSLLMLVCLPDIQHSVFLVL